MSFKHNLLALAASLAIPAGAVAAPVTDCAGRNAPFSTSSPLVDILLSPAATAVVDKAMNGRLSKLPKQFFGTTAPTFAAILTLKDGAMITGLSSDAVAGLDPQLRALPVTAADKIARCARYDNERPRFDLPKGKPNMLVFQKINGFYHTDAVPAADTAFTAMAARKGWGIAVTDKGGAINPATLRQFSVVVWNNNSGDVLTLSQRKALRSFVENGGGFIALHGAGGDSAYFWDWYIDKVLGVRFTAHPMSPQFQEARVVVEDGNHPIAKALPKEWRMTDEWYSFAESPRKAGAHVILTLDEATYKPLGMGNRDLHMGDHPIAWTMCLGKGRSFYSAIGHRAESYTQPQNVALLEAALDWAADRHQPCESGSGK
ncbi:MAG: ThuA domain-containing protein [Novosphingobium sp.]